MAERRRRRLLNGRVGVSVVGTATVTGTGLAAGLDNVSNGVRVACTTVAALLAGGLAALPDGYFDARRDEPARGAAARTVAGRLPSRTRARRVPQQLPPVTRHFTGREEILAEMTRLLTADRAPGAGAPVIAVYGKAGVGKTVLGVRFAHEMAARYPDGQLYLNLRGPDWEPQDTGVVLASFLGALGVHSTAIPAELDDRQRLYAARLAGKRVLVLLDNAASEAQVRPLLPASPTCAVVITSRRRLTGLIDAHCLGIDVIPDTTSVELLGKIAGEGRVVAEPDAAAEIVRLCGRLPLAVCIVAAKLDAKPHWKLGRMLERLRDEQGRLAELEMDDDAGFQASVTLSYEELSEEERRAFRLLGLVRSGGLPGWILAPLLDIDVTRSEALMERLVDAQLMETPAEESDAQPYRFHDLIRVYARERLAVDEPLGARHESVVRLLGAYLTLAEHAVQCADPDGVTAVLGPGEDAGAAPRWRPGDTAFTAISAEDPLRWFITQCRPLARAVTQARDRELWRFAWQIGTLLFTQFDSVRSHWSRWQDTFDAALTGARRDGSRFGQASLLHARGALFRDEDRFAEASGQFDKALALFRELGDRKGEAQTLRSLGELHRARGRFVEAEGCLTEALRISREISDRMSEARALRDLGGIHRSLRRSQAARRELEAALAISRQVGDSTGEGITLRSIAGVKRDQRRFDEATEDLEAARAILGDLGNQVWEARTVYSLGRVRLEQGRIAEADVLLTEVLRSFTELGYRLWVARTQRALARVRLAQGRYAEAAEAVADALVGFDELEMRLWRGHTLRTQGEVLIAEHRYAAAAEALTEAVAIFGEYEDAWSRADALRMLGAARRGLRRYDGAKAAHYEALEIFRDFGDTWGEAATLDEMAATGRVCGERLRARALRRQARALRAERMP